MTLTIGAQTPKVLGGMRLTLARRGAPGTLRFSVLKDAALDFHEGDLVRVPGLFYGYVFEKSRTGDGAIDVLAYDQLRYLKNRDTYAYTDQTATALIRAIARDTGITCGTLAETGVLLTRIEQDKTLFDIIENALAETRLRAGKRFTLSDDEGKLTLTAPRRAAYTLDAQSAGRVDYTSSIDSDVYTRVRQGEATVTNAALARRFGILQYFEREETAPAETILAQYGRETRTLRVLDARGDTAVRPGVLVPTRLDLGDVVVDEDLLVEAVTHTWRGNLHTMDLTLKGGSRLGTD